MRALIPLLLLACSWAVGCSRMGHYALIRSFPTGASVTVDGRPVGLTPAVLRESGKQGKMYGIKLTRDECMPLFDAVRATEAETRSAQWNLLWRLPGVKRTQALPDTMWYVLRHSRWRFTDAPFVSERVVLTKYDAEDLLPEVRLAFECTEEFDGAGKEFLGVEGHVLHFRAHAERSTSLSLIFGFVQGDEAHVPEPWDPMRLGVFDSRVTRLSEGQRKGEQKAYRSFRRRNPLPTDGADEAVTITERSGRETITLKAEIYRPPEERETLGAGESLHGWVVLPESFDLEAPITILWNDEITVATLKLAGQVKHVRHDGVLVLDSGEKVRLAGVEFLFEQLPGGRGRAVRGRRSLDLVSLDKRISFELESKERNVYGHLLSYVYVGDTFLNEVLVNEGLARIRYQPEGPFFDRFVEAYLSAKGAGRGIWQSPGGEHGLTMVLEIEAPEGSDAEPAEEEERVDLEGSDAEPPEEEEQVELEGSDAETPEEGGEEVEPEGSVLVIRNGSDEVIDLEGFELFTDVGPGYRFPQVVLAPGEELRLHSGMGDDEAPDLFWGLRQDPWGEEPAKGFLCNAKGTVIGIYLHSGTEEQSSEVSEEM